MTYLRTDELMSVLTPREQDVVDRIARGLEIKEIAHELQIGYHTAKMHIARAKHKLGARNQIEIAILLHGGRPQAMPAAHEHPIRLCREMAPEAAWRHTMRYRVRRS
mgnify:CR=1 FL=1